MRIDFEIRRSKLTYELTYESQNLVLYTLNNILGLWFSEKKGRLLLLSGVSWMWLAKLADR